MLALNLANFDVDRAWTLKGTVKAAAYGSGERHTSWVFHRSDAPKD